MKITDEQQYILDLVKKGHKYIKIYAYAGCGKTTTLKLIAEENKDKRILYLAFNKAIQLEAKNKFPSNVDVKTTHSLAYGHIVYKNSYNVRNGDYKLIELKNILDIDDFTLLSSIKGSLNNFFNSDVINVEDMSKKELYLPDKNIDIDDVKKYTNELYKLMKNKFIDITHSFYLKEFQLQLAKKELYLKPYDIILLDEAQDTNPVVFNIFRYLPAKQKILVGDKHQQIYSFRGAVNALDNEFSNEKRAYLTKSFRVSSQLSDKVNIVLRDLKFENKEFKGVNSNSDKSDTIAFISRTNSFLIKKFAFLLDADVELKDISFIRNPYEIFGLALNVVKLLQGKEIDDNYKYLLLYNANNRSELEDIAKKGEDQELYTALQVSKFIGYNKLFDLYFKAKECFNNKKARYFLTTAHTSKGLEWDSVEILGDFNFLKTIVELGTNSIEEKDFFDEWIENNKEKFFKNIKRNVVFNRKLNMVEEINLLYVAITRARYNLIIDDANLAQFLEIGLDEFIERLIKGVLV